VSGINSLTVIILNNTLTSVGMLDRLDMLPARLGGFHMLTPPE